MEYIIKNKELRCYFNSKKSCLFHFVLDIDNAYVFKNKWDANKMLKGMEKLREYKNMEVIKYEKKKIKKVGRK
jgi:hypothetical protein